MNRQWRSIVFGFVVLLGSAAFGIAGAQTLEEIQQAEQERLRQEILQGLIEWQQQQEAEDARYLQEMLQQAAEEERLAELERQRQAEEERLLQELIEWQRLSITV